MTATHLTGSNESGETPTMAAPRPGLLTPLTPAGFSCDDAFCAF